MLLSSSQRCRESSLKPFPKKRIHADHIPLSLRRSGQFCTNRISTNTESGLQTQPVEHNAAQLGFIEEFVALRVIRIAPSKAEVCTPIDRCSSCTRQLAAHCIGHV